MKRALFLSGLWLLGGCGSQDRSGPPGLLPGSLRVQNLETGSSPLFIQASDLDGDGLAELIASDRRGNKLQFLSGPNYAVSRVVPLTHSPGEVEVGDFVGDARPDVAVALRDGSEILLLENNSRVTVGTAPQSLESADFDGDGRADLVVSCVGSNNLHVLFGQAGGGLGSAVVMPTGNNPVQVEVADYNGDGRADIACSNFGSGSVSVFTNSGNRQFALSQTLAVGNGAFGLLAPDLNGDGRADLVVANEADGTLTRYLQSGGTLAEPATFPVGRKPDCLAALDTDGDGRDELLVTLEDESGVAVVSNDGAGALTRLSLAETSGGPVGIATLDRVSAATANFFGTGVSLLRVVLPPTALPTSALTK